MKVSPLFTLFIFIQHFSFGQINYQHSNHNSPFVLLTSDTSINLTAAYPSAKSMLDESFANQIPIGFDFYYNGEKYNVIHLNTNGFASLGAPFLQSNTDPQYDINELRNPVAYKGAIRPILAPFWDNLQLSDMANITYKTEGTAPNRTFIAQWKNMIWQNGGPDGLSFQLRLYESSNIIRFHYGTGPGSIGVNPGASIGITSDKNKTEDPEAETPYYISLNGSGNASLAYDSIETDVINTKPANGQEFRFTPLACVPPNHIKLLSQNANAVTLSWLGSNAGANYQMALSNIDVEPTVGTTVSATSHTFSNLAPNTVYFFYIKESCGSAWKKFRFKTSTRATLPYNQGFESGLDIDLPADISSQTLANDFAGMHWQNSHLLNAASGSKKAINSARFAKADSWLYTPAIPLQVGGVYQLSFKYSRTAASDIGLMMTPNLKILVKYGFGTGNTGMIDTIVFLNNISNNSYNTQISTFSPSSSGDYILGFGFQSDVTDAIVLLDDIQVTVLSVPLPLRLLSFDAKLNAQEEVDLTWTTSHEENVSHFEAEHSTDGKTFSTLGKIPANKPDDDITNHYQLTHPNPVNGHNYYRLKMVDLDGKFEYSPLRWVDLSDELVTLLYPNPSGYEVFLKMPGVKDASILVYNLEGKMLNAQFANFSENECKISLNAQVSSGIYLVAVSTKTETRILKWMIE